MREEHLGCSGNTISELAGRLFDVNGHTIFGRTGEVSTCVSGHNPVTGAELIRAILAANHQIKVIQDAVADMEKLLATGGKA